MSGNGEGIRLVNVTDSGLYHNEANGNTAGSGIFVVGTSTGNLLLQNAADGNRNDGIHVEGAGNTVRGNDADRNGDLGIFSSLSNIDAAGTARRTTPPVAVLRRRLLLTGSSVRVLGRRAGSGGRGPDVASLLATRLFRRL